MRDTVLSIRITADGRVAVQEFDRVRDASRRLGDDTRAGAGRAGQDFDRVREAARRLGQETRASGGQAGQGLQQIAGAARSAETALGGTVRQVAALTAGLVALNLGAQALTALPRAGIAFAANIEVAKLGMAGVLTSMTRIDGQAMQMNQALAIAGDYIRKLNDDALRTAASSQELVTVFQGLLAPGLAAKMTLEQIRQLTVTGVNAVKSLNLASTQYLQELRDMVQGGIVPASSTLATALGISDADIKRIKANGASLFDFLMERMRGFEIASNMYGETLKGRFDTLKEGATRVAAEGFTPLTEALKGWVAEVSSLFLTVEKRTVEVKGKMVEVSELKLNNDAIANMHAVAEGAVAVGNAIRSVAGFVAEHRNTLLLLGEAYVGLRLTMAAASFAPVIAGAAASTLSYIRLHSAVLSGNAVLLGSAQADRMKAASTLATVEANLAAARASQVHAATVAAQLREEIALEQVRLRAQINDIGRMHRLRDLAALSQALAVATRNLAAADAELAAASTAAGTAQQRLAAATTAAGAATRIGGGLLAALGGPLGLVITALGIGATAWMMFGSAAQTEAVKAAAATGDVIAETDKLIAKLKERNALQGQNPEVEQQKSGLQDKIREQARHVSDLEQRAAAARQKGDADVANSWALGATAARQKLDELVSKVNELDAVAQKASTGMGKVTPKFSGALARMAEDFLPKAEKLKLELERLQKAREEDITALGANPDKQALADIERQFALAEKGIRERYKSLGAAASKNARETYDTIIKAATGAEEVARQQREQTETALKTSLDQGRISYEQYYQGLKDAAVAYAAEAQKQTGIQLDAARQRGDSSDMAKYQAELLTQTQALYTAFAKIEGEFDSKTRALAETVAGMVANAEIDALKAQGKLVEAERARIALEFGELQKDLAKLGNGPDAQDARARFTRYTGALLDKAQVAEWTQQAKSALGEFDDRLQQIRDANPGGLFGDIASVRAQLNLQQQYALGVLTTLESARQEALSKGLAADATALDNQIRDARAKLQALPDDARKLRGDIAAFLTDALNAGFNGGKDGAKNFVKSLQATLKSAAFKIAVQAIVTPTSANLASALTGSAQAGGTASGGGMAPLGSLYNSFGNGNLPSVSGLVDQFSLSPIGQNLGLSAYSNGAFGGYTDLAAQYGNLSELGQAGTQLTSLGQSASSFAGTAASAAAWVNVGVNALNAFKTGKGWGATAGGAIGMIWGPIGSMIGSAIGGAIDKLTGGGGAPKAGGHARTDYTPGVGHTASLNSQRFFTPAQGDADMAQLVQVTSKSYLAAMARLGGKAGVHTFGVGFDTDPNGSAPNRVSGDAFLNGQQVYFNRDRNIGRDNNKIQEELALESQRMLLAAVKASDLPAEVARIISEGVPDAVSASAEQIQTALDDASFWKSAFLDTPAALKAVFTEVLSLDAFRGVQQEGETLSATFARIAPVFEATNLVAQALGRDTATAFGAVGLASQEARQRLVSFAGGAQALGQNASGYYQNYFTQAERETALRQRLTQEFADLGVAMPDTIQGFRKLVEAQDPATESGARLIAGLLRLQDGFSAVHGSASVLAERQTYLASLDEQMASLGRSDLDTQLATVARQLDEGRKKLAELGDTSAASAAQLETLAQKQRDALVATASTGVTADSLSKLFADAIANSANAQAAGQKFAQDFGQAFNQNVIGTLTGALGKMTFDQIITPMVTGALSADMLGVELDKLDSKFKAMAAVLNTDAWKDFAGRLSTTLSGIAATAYTYLPGYAGSGYTPAAGNAGGTGDNRDDAADKAKQYAAHLKDLNRSLADLQAGGDYQRQLLAIQREWDDGKTRLAELGAAEGDAAYAILDHIKALKEEQLATDRARESADFMGGILAGLNTTPLANAFRDLDATLAKNVETATRLQQPLERINQLYRQQLNDMALAAWQALTEAQGNDTALRNLNQGIREGRYQAAYQAASQSLGFADSAGLDAFLSATQQSLEQAAVSYWGALSTVQQQAVASAVQAKAEFLTTLKAQEAAQREQVQNMARHLDTLRTLGAGLAGDMAQLRIEAGQLDASDYAAGQLAEAKARLVHIYKTGANLDEVAAQAETVRRLVNERYRAEVEAEQRRLESAYQYGDYLASLRVGDKSNQSIALRLSEAQRQFADAAMQANAAGPAGDKARAKLTSLADTLLDLARQRFGAGSGYDALLAQVQTTLEPLALSGSVDQQQLAQQSAIARHAEAALSELQGLRAATDFVADREQQKLGQAVATLGTLHGQLAGLGTDLSTALSSLSLEVRGLMAGFDKVVSAIGPSGLGGSASSTAPSTRPPAPTLTPLSLKPRFDALNIAGDWAGIRDLAVGQHWSRFNLSAPEAAGGLGWSIFDIESILTGMQVPFFDQGADLLPQDMLAMVHEGERIVPAADNRDLLAALAERNQVARQLADLLPELQALRRSLDALHADQRRGDLANVEATVEAAQQVADSIDRAMRDSAYRSTRAVEAGVRL